MYLDRDDDDVEFMMVREAYLSFLLFPKNHACHLTFWSFFLIPRCHAMRWDK